MSAPLPTMLTKDVSRKLSNMASKVEIPLKNPTEFYSFNIDNDGIGKGAFAKVYKVRRKTDDKELAMKITDNSKLPTDQLAKLRECFALQKVKCKYCVELLDLFNDKIGNTYILMTLMDYNAKIFIIKKNWFTNDELLHFAAQLFEGLKYLHTLDIHRDIKPENLLFGREGILKICDFNLARQLVNDTSKQSVAGTLGYMCPEMNEGKPYDESSETWSASIILMKLTGKFNGEFKELKKYNVTWSKYDVIIKQIVTESKDVFKNSPLAEIIIKGFVKDGKARIKAAEICEILNTVNVTDNKYNKLYLFANEKDINESECENKEEL
eukprot:429538_1